jgi:hypothetical protein
MFTPAQSRFGLDRHRVPRELRLASIVCALAIAAGVAGAFSFNTIFIPSAGRPSFVWLTTFFFRAQDAPWLLFIALMLLGFGVLCLPAMTRYAASAMLQPTGGDCESNGAGFRLRYHRHACRLSRLSLGARRNSSRVRRNYSTIGQGDRAGRP